jgi:hypothetical protein
LVISGVQRENRDFLALATQVLALDPVVAFTHQNSDVYLPKSRKESTVARLRDAPVFDQVVPRGDPGAHAATPEPDRRVRTVNLHADRGLFGHMAPMPGRYHFSFDPNVGTIDGQTILTAHPDAELWFVPPPGMTEITCAYGILPGAYERAGAATDGVEFSIAENRPDGTEQVLFHRWLQPASTAADRGLQRLLLPYRPVPGAELVFSTRPGGNYAFDWAYWGPVKLH